MGTRAVKTDFLLGGAETLSLGWVCARVISVLWRLRGEAACGLGLHAEFGFHFSEGEAGDAEDFLAGEITAEHGDGATR